MRSPRTASAKHDFALPTLARRPHSTVLRWKRSVAVQIHTRPASCCPSSAGCETAFRESWRGRSGVRVFDNSDWCDGCFHDLVGTIPTHSFSAAHFATFPPALVEPCILSGTSARGVCAACGAPWVRETETSYVKSPVHGEGSVMGRHEPSGENGWDGMPRVSKRVETTGWHASCQCNAATVPATVLDPFCGSGTVGLVAERLQRDAILIEISATYAEMAEKRIRDDAPLLTDATITTATAARASGTTPSASPRASPPSRTTAR